MTNIQRTFVAIKPDGVERGLVGKIISRFEDRGLKIIAIKMMLVPKEMAESHYAEHKGKRFYNALVSYMTSAPVVALILEGKGAVTLVRNVIGATNPADATPGTIRGDFALDIGRNVVHGSDSLESARREIDIFFQDENLPSWCRSLDKWIFE